MRVHSRVLPLAALAVLAAACSTPAAQPATVPVEQPAASATPSPAVPSQQPVGRTQTSTSDKLDVKVTVLRLRQPFTPIVDGVLDRKGYVYAAVEVKMCATRNDEEATAPLYVSWGPWSLGWESGVVVEAAGSYSPRWWDEPLYPQDHVVRVGRCARGWIPFEVSAKNGKPDQVLYTPVDLTPLEWEVAR